MPKTLPPLPDAPQATDPGPGGPPPLMVLPAMEASAREPDRRGSELCDAQQRSAVLLDGSHKSQHEPVLIVSDGGPRAGVAVDDLSPPETPQPEEADFLRPADRPLWLNLALLPVLMCFGWIEGFAFHRTGVLFPDAIYKQFLFRIWIIMKMFVAAVGSSILFNGILEFWRPDLFDRTRDYKHERWSILRVLVGGGLVGCGMVLCGGGATMLPSQIGANVGHAWATFVGFLVGGVAFSIVDKVFPGKLGHDVPTEEDPTAMNERWIKVAYWKLAIPMGLVIVGLVVGFEFIVKQSDDERRLGVGDVPWPPVVAGVITGFNQVPLRLIAGHGQGGATAVMTVIATVTWGFLAPGAKPQLTGLKNVWQFVFVYGGTLLGAVAAAQIYKDETHIPTGFTIARSMVGGFVNIIGARIAGGCTCGHGISGMSELSYESVLAVVGMFGAGIPLAFALDALGWY